MLDYLTQNYTSIEIFTILPTRSSNKNHITQTETTVLDTLLRHSLTSKRRTFKNAKVIFYVLSLETTSL